MPGLKAAALPVALGAFLPALPLLAQEKPHAGHDPPPAADSVPRRMPERPFGIPMTLMGSRTGWFPDASAMYAWHFMAGQWMMMRMSSGSTTTN